MNLDSLLPGTIPDFSQCPRDDVQIQMLMKRIEVAKALGMFKISESEFLLCYDSESDEP
jgi:CNH domain